MAPSTLATHHLLRITLAGARITLLSGLLQLAPGCVHTSTRSDVNAVHGIVHERSELKKLALPTLPKNSDPESTAKDPEVTRLLGEPLTVESAIRVALLNNRGLRADLLDLGVARGQLVQASVFPNPEIEATVRFSERDGVDPTWDLGFGFDITGIVLRGTLQEIAEAELDAARIRAAGATLDLAFEVRLAYYELQHAEQRVALQKTSLDTFAASFETAHALHEVGNVTALDLATKQAAFEAARADVSEAEAVRLARRERMAVLLGVFGTKKELNVSAQLAAPAAAMKDLERLEERAVNASLELAQARAMLTAGSRRIGFAADKGSLPELHLGISAEHEEHTWAVGPSISGSLPLFDQNVGGAISARAQLNAQRERYAATANEIRSAVRSARDRALSAQARAQHQHDTLLPLRARVVRETLLQYNAMQASVFQLLQARRDELASSAMYVDTLLEYWRARATLDQLLAGRRPYAGASTSMPSASMSQPSADLGAH